MSVVEFVPEPPPSGMTQATRRRYHIAQALKAQPGDWARIFTGSEGAASGLCSAITLGLGVFHGGVWEATRRKEDDGQVSAYARFVRAA